MNIKKIIEKINRNFINEDEELDENETQSKLLKYNKYLSNKELMKKVMIGLVIVGLLLVNLSYSSIQRFFQNLLNVRPLGKGIHIFLLFRFPIWEKSYILIVIIYLLCAGFACLRLMYLLQISFKNLNVGQKGKTRWTTDEELKQQYLSIPATLSKDCKYRYYDVPGNNPEEKEENYKILFLDIMQQTADYLNSENIEVKSPNECYCSQYFDKEIKEYIRLLKNREKEFNKELEIDYKLEIEEKLKKAENLKKSLKNLRGMKAPYDYEGTSGIIISWDRKNDRVFLEQEYTNTKYIGTSRIGKGEMFILPTVDTLSRAYDKPSMVFFDPKAELLKMSADTLIERGYIVWSLNLYQPKYSMGYNILSLIVKYYKNEEYATAELLCKSLAVNIYHPDKEGSDAFWDNNSVSLLSALILASCDDCLKADALLIPKLKHMIQINRKKESEDVNEIIQFYTLKGRNTFDKVKEAGKKLMIQQIALTEENLEDEQNQYLLQLTKTEKEELQQLIQELYQLYQDDEGKLEENQFREILPIIFAKYYDNENLNYYEQKINMYSILLTFAQLNREKIDNDKTMMDIYFNSRGELDRAKLKWNSIEVAGDRTKGSIFSSMLTQLEIFTYESIAKITSQNDMDLMKLGFECERPIALFLNVPDYDKSFHFLATICIDQVYFVNAQRATLGTGKTEKDIVNICDEICSFPKISLLQEKAAVSLGKKIRWLFFVQEDRQLELVYGEKEAEVISGLCHNQIYIMSGNKKTANDFADQIGTKTNLSIDRSGNRFSLDKSYSEHYENINLIDGDRLQRLLSGENVVKRVLHRRDLNGNDHYQTPIFNKDNRRFKFRYEYLQDYFPNPETINLVDEEIFKEIDVNLSERIYNVSEWIRLEYEKMGVGNGAKNKTEKIMNKKFQQILKDETNPKINVMWDNLYKEVFADLVNFGLIDILDVMNLTLKQFYQEYLLDHKLQRMGFPALDSKINGICRNVIVSIINQEMKEERSYMEVY